MWWISPFFNYLATWSLGSSALTLIYPCDTFVKCLFYFRIHTCFGKCFFNIWSRWDSSDVSVCQFSLLNLWSCSSSLWAEKWISCIIGREWRCYQWSLESQMCWHFLKTARFLEPVYKSDYVTEPLQIFVSSMMDHKIMFTYSISCQFCQLSVLWYNNAVLDG